MAGKRESASKRSASAHDTKARIAASATKLFARKGYAATSIQEICQASGANIAAVNYYFQSKENLYRHIVSNFGTHSLDNISQILQSPATEDEFRVRLEMFLEFAADMVAQQPDVSRIIVRDVDIMTSMCRDIYINTFCRIYICLVSFLKCAVQRGILRRDTNPDMVAQLLFGPLTSQHNSDREIREMLKSGDFADAGYRRRWVRGTVSLILSGIKG